MQIIWSIFCTACHTCLKNTLQDSGYLPAPTKNSLKKKKKKSPNSTLPAKYKLGESKLCERLQRCFFLQWQTRGAALIPCVALVNYGGMQYIVHIKLSNAGVCSFQQPEEIADGCIWSDHKGVILWLSWCMQRLIFLSVQPAGNSSLKWWENLGKLKNQQCELQLHWMWVFSPECDPSSQLINIKYDSEIL